MRLAPAAYGNPADGQSLCSESDQYFSSPVCLRQAGPPQGELRTTDEENRLVTESTTYSLKAIIAARALAEITVLAVLTLLPVVLLASGHFLSIHPILRCGICLLSPLSLFGLWAFGQIAFKVSVSDSGLTLRSVLKRQFIRWQDISILKQTNRIGFREYLIVHEQGELGFPCLLNRCAELVEIIRSRLPGRGRSTTGDVQFYKVKLTTVVAEVFKLLLQFGFSALFFCFAGSLKQSGRSSSEDFYVVVGAAVLIAAVVLWKLLQFLRLPQEVRLSGEGLTVRGVFSSASIAWSEIGKAQASGILYPEGVVISAGRRKYLLADIFDCFDELIEEIQQRCRSCQT
jgi:hypothetical protein